MAQDRMLRAAMRSSEKVNEWPIELRYFWTQLWGYCDDWGRGRWDNRLIKADTFPLDDDVTAARVGRWMQGLEKSGVIASYVIAGRMFFECVNWDEHQPLTYAKKTDVPDRDGVVPAAGKKVSRTVQNVPENSRKFQKVPLEGEEEVEEEGEGKNADASPPPRFCPKHPNDTDTPCIACRRARTRYEAWEQTHQAVKPKRAHRHRWAADGTCTGGDGCTEVRP